MTQEEHLDYLDRCRKFNKEQRDSQQANLFTGDNDGVGIVVIVIIVVMVIASFFK